MRALLLSLLASAFLSLCSFSRADDVSPRNVEDLSPEEFEELAQLSVDLRSLTVQSSGNITNDVAAILSWLNSLAVYVTGGNTYLQTWPRVSSNQYLGNFLARLLSDQDLVSSNQSREQGYLYQIRELLKSIPTNSIDRLTDAFLDFIKDDGGLTLRETIDDIDATAYYSWELLHSIDGRLDDYLSPLLSTARGVSNYLASFEYSDGLWHSHLDDTQLQQILDVLSTISESSADSSTTIGDFQSYVGEDLSSVITHLGMIEDYLYEISDYTYDIHYYDLDYAGTDRSVQKDFLYLQQQIGVDRPNATNNLSSILRSMVDPSAALSVVRDMSNEVASVSSLGDTVASDTASFESATTNIAESVEPDWTENAYTGDNPIESVSDDLKGSAQSIIRSMTPSLPESQNADKEIVLYRGAFPVFGGPSLRSATSVNLNISYPLTDYDDVSNGLNMMRTIMEYVWSFVTILICGCFLLRFWQHAAKIASGIATGHFEESGSLD